MATPKHESGLDKAFKKKRGNYSVFRYNAGDSDGSSKTRLKHGLSHGEMHHELKHNPEYRGTKEHGFAGGRTYSRKK